MAGAEPGARMTTQHDQLAFSQTLECAAIECAISVVACSGRERISECFTYELVILSHGTRLDATSLVGAEAALRVRHGEGTARWIHGVIASCQDRDHAVADGATYALTLRPRLWRTSLVQLTDIQMELTIPGIVQKKLEQLNWAVEQDFQLRVNDDYTNRDFVVQYQETDLAFVSRLCEHLGIFYFFEQDEDRDIVVFADRNSACPPALPDDGKAQYRERGDEPGVHRLTATSHMLPGRFIQRDYNYRTPNVDLLGHADLEDSHGGGIYEYGSHVKSSEEAADLARIRAEQRAAASHKVYEGESNLPQLSPGHLLHLEGHPSGEVELLITEVSHHSDAEQTPAYRNHFKAISAALPYRPPRTTMKPVVNGMLTGIIEAKEDSEYADIDDQGRYRVRFLFDAVLDGERQASRPIRMMQPSSGPGYGMHFPLRSGVEVLIGFVGGDPDRPIIAGAVPNPQTASPVSAENRERSVIRTSGGNEINIDDTDGAERIKLSTPRHDSVLQIGSPNAAEDGVHIGTTANASIAGSTINLATMFQNNWSTFSNTWGNHIVDFAGALTPWQKVGGGFDLVRAQLGAFTTAIDTHSAIDEARLATDLKRFSEARGLWEDGNIQAGRERALRAMSECVDSARIAAEAEVVAAEDALRGATDETREQREVARTAAAEKLAALTDAAANFENAFGAYTLSERQMDLLAADRLRLEEKIEIGNTALTALKEQETAAADADLDRIEESYEQSIATQTQKVEGLYDSVEATSKDLVASRSTLEKQGKDVDDRLGDLKKFLPDACKRKVATLRTSQRDYDAIQQNFLTKREHYEIHKSRLGDARSLYQRTRATNDTLKDIDKNILGNIDAAMSLFAFALGTGIKGYALGTATKLREYAAGQYGGDKDVRYPLPHFGSGLRLPRLTPKVDAEAGKPLPFLAKKLGKISRVDWSSTLESMKMGSKGGGGLTGSAKLFGLPLLLIPVLGPLLAKTFTTDAFKESRNIQGSEEHSVCFGKRSVHVASNENAALTADKKVVVTAEREATFHSRGTTEIAGDSVLLSSGRLVDIMTRGRAIMSAAIVDAKVGESGPRPITEMTMDRATWRVRSYSEAQDAQLESICDGRLNEKGLEKKTKNLEALLLVGATHNALEIELNEKFKAFSDAEKKIQDCEKELADHIRQGPNQKKGAKQKIYESEKKKLETKAETAWTTADGLETEFIKAEKSCKSEANTGRILGKAKKEVSFATVNRDWEQTSSLTLDTNGVATLVAGEAKRSKLKLDDAAALLWFEEEKKKKAGLVKIDESKLLIEHPLSAEIHIGETPVAVFGANDITIGAAKHKLVLEGEDIDLGGTLLIKVEQLKAIEQTTSESAKKAESAEKSAEKSAVEAKLSAEAAEKSAKAAAEAKDKGQSSN